MSEKNWAKRISVFLLAFAMLFTVIIPSSMDKVYAEGGANAPVTVNLTISNKTALKDLKNDYGTDKEVPNGAKNEILSKQITVNDGESVLDAIKRELGASNIAYQLNGTKGFNSIAGLKEKLGILSEVTKGGRKSTDDFSGWYNFLNGASTNVGLDQMKNKSGLAAGEVAINNGDSIAIKYSVDGVEFDNEYNQVFTIDSSIKNLELKVGDTYEVPLDKLKYKPENWSSAKSFSVFFFMVDKDKVLKVNNTDRSVKFIAKSPGTTTIRIETPNELADTMTVTVKAKSEEKPEPRLVIDGTNWDMTKVFETEKSGPHSLKVQVKKNGQYVDVDKNKVKWNISNGATSRVFNGAFWITVDHEATFTATLEEFPNEKVSFRAKIKPVPMTDFDVKLPTTYRISAWNNLAGSWSSKTSGSYYVGIIEGEGTDNYKILPKPANASNTEVTWEALTPEIATYMELFKNGIIPVKAGTAKFKVSSKANPSVSKIIEVKLEYKVPMTEATPEEEEVVLKVGETKNVNFNFSPAKPSEQRFNWTFDQPGIVDNEEVVESSGVTGALPTFLHKITGLQKGTVTATATPWDTTGGAKPVKVKIHVLGTMTIKPNRELNKDNNVEIEDGNLTYTKNVSDKATYYISNSILSRLLNVKVDGAVIDSSNYETEEGSIILNLKRNYLNTLAPGNHTLEVETRDGRVETAFTINAAPVTYKATHEYKSITPGMELPYDVTRFLPHTIYDLPDQRIVILGNRYREIEVAGGKWIFRGWNPESATVNGADLHFVGSWEFVANPVQPVAPPAAASSNKGAANGSAITNNKVVNTGDASGLVHMIMLLAFASTMMTVLVIRKRVK
jgi:surface protein pspA